MRLIRYWVLKQIGTLLCAYLIDTDREEEAKNFGNWLDIIMPKIRSGQVKIK